MSRESFEDLLRDLAPQVLGALMHRYGRLDAGEDAVQEALLAAATQWPADGVPANPRAWLITVASRRLTDWIRSDVARSRREDSDARSSAMLVARGSDEPPAGSHDDTLTLLFLCCHPALSPPSQVALTLRAVGGAGWARTSSRPRSLPSMTRHRGWRRRIGRRSSRCTGCSRRSHPTRC